MPAILDKYPPNHPNLPHYSSAKSEITWPNGAKLLLLAAEAGEDSPRGTQCEVLLCDEACFYGHNEGIIVQALLTCRLGMAKAFFFTTPKKTPWTVDIINKSKEEGQKYVKVITGSTMENSDNLAPAFIETIKGQFEGTRMERVELYGELILEAEGALWTMDTIYDNEIDDDDIDFNEFVEYGIGVDPATTTKKKSDLTGLVISAKTVDNTVVTLYDFSSKMSAETWAKKVVELYQTYTARGATVHIVVERNAGGDLVKDSIARVNPYVADAVDYVFSSASKLQRATPFSLLAEQGRIKYRKTTDGHLTPLYDELTGYDGTQRKSPDRMDAAVFSWSKLAPLNTKRVRVKELM